MLTLLEFAYKFIYHHPAGIKDICNKLGGVVNSPIITVVSVCRPEYKVVCAVVFGKGIKVPLLSGIDPPVESKNKTIPATPPIPVGPVAPVFVALPAAPVGPVSPVAPVFVALPGVPVGPEAPVGPVSPVGPEAPVAPVLVANPGAPVGPEAPVGPVAPVLVANPGAPVGPVAPVHPVEPVGPVAPVTPGRLSNISRIHFKTA